MRPSFLIAALAVGAVSAFEKRVYVTDYTTTIVYQTVTQGAAENPPATQQAPPAQTVYETKTMAAPAETTTTTTTTNAAPEATTNQAPQPAPAPQHQDSHVQNQAQPQPQPAPAPQNQNTQPQNQAQPEPQPDTATTSYYTTQWTSTVDPSTTMSTSTSEPTAPPMSPYQQAVLYNHNIHRSNHSAPSVDWSSDLESSARKLASGCVYEHNTSIDGGGYGQNIGYGVQENQVGVLITNLMYNDEIGYFPTPYGTNSPSMANFERWGHFSQIVWKDTTHVGCATVMCNGLQNVDASSSLPFTVCNYSPAGNYDGEYANNVLAPQGQASYNAY